MTPWVLMRNNFMKGHEQHYEKQWKEFRASEYEFWVRASLCVVGQEFGRSRMPCQTMVDVVRDKFHFSFF